MTVFDVDPSVLIKEVAKDFKQRLEKPEWTEWAKTGSHAERAPQNRDWWFERAASILYRVYKDGPLGTESFRTYYGGRKNRGVKPEKKRKSSGKIIRTCLQTLEKEGLIKKGKRGRVITGKGESYLTKFARQAKQNLGKKVQQAVQKEKRDEDLEVKEARQALKQQEKKEEAKEKQQKPKHKEEKTESKK